MKLGPPLRFETPDFIFRSLVHGDETEEWAGWLANPVTATVLNAARRALSLSDLQAYISRFDRIDRHLFGIFEKSTTRLIGIRTVEIDRTRRAYSVHMLVGSNTDWGRGSMDQTTEVLNNWAYETCDLLWSEASVLAINKKMVRFLTASGWTTVGKAMGRSARDAKLIDIVKLRRHRDIWRKDSRSSFMTGTPPATGLEPA